MSENILPQLNSSEESIKKLHEEVTEAVRHGRATLLLMLIIALFFLLQAVPGITNDMNILKEEEIHLPPMEVSVSVVTFYIAAPVLLLLAHLYVIFALVKVAKGARELQERYIRGERVMSAFTLPQFSFVQFLFASKGLRKILLGASVFLQIGVVPIIVFLALQLRSLAYQYEAITLLHQSIITVDIALLFYFFWVVHRANDVKLIANGKAKVFSVFKCFLATITGLTVAVFVWFVAVVPAEPAASNMPEVSVDKWVQDLLGAWHRNITKLAFNDWWDDGEKTDETYSGYSCNRFVDICEKVIPLKLVTSPLPQEMKAEMTACNFFGRLDLNDRNSRYSIFSNSSSDCGKIYRTEQSSAKMKNVESFGSDVEESKFNNSN